MNKYNFALLPTATKNMLHERQRHEYKASKQMMILLIERSNLGRTNSIVKHRTGLRRNTMAPDAILMAAGVQPSRFPF